MTITLNVPTEVEALLRAQAKAAGMEVEEYSARLLGQMLRSLMPEALSDERQEPRSSAVAPKKKTIADLKGYGKFADILPSTEDLARRKQEEIEQEESRAARRDSGATR